jgi:hypothetical protein
MQYRLFILLLTITADTFGQNLVDYGQLNNSWTQGKIDPNGIVIKADINRAGFYYLDIHLDTTVVFRDPYTCGEGFERHGKWTLSKADTTITFFFTKRFGYMEATREKDINETETYKIKKLTTDELILTHTVGLIGETWPFIKTKK